MASFTIILYIDHIRDVNITTYLICHLYSSPSIPCFITQYLKYCGSVADLSLFFRGSVIVFSWFCHDSVMTLCRDSSLLSWFCRDSVVIHRCCHGSVTVLSWFSQLAQVTYTATVLRVLNSHTTTRLLREE